MPTAAGASLACSQEPKIQSRAPLWVAGTSASAATTAAHGPRWQEVGISSQSQELNIDTSVQDAGLPTNVLTPRLNTHPKRVTF